MLVVELIFLGLLVGLLSSFFGLGGGVVIVPLLPFIIPIEPVEVVWVSLACIIFIVATNVIAFHRQELIEWKIVRRLGPLAIMGGLLAPLVSVWVAGPTLRIITGLLLLFLAAQMVFLQSGGRFGSILHRFLQPLAFFGGFASGLTGVGTGALLSPILLQTGRVEPKKISPTVNGILLGAALVSLISYIVTRKSDLLQMGKWHFISIAIICMVSFLAAIWGRKHQVALPEHIRRKILGILLFSLSTLVLGRVFLT